MRATVYKAVLCIVDHEDMPEESVIHLLENVRYLYPNIISLESREIEEWNDEHPLNKKDTHTQEFGRLFNGIHSK
jgi:hypothetical protein